LKGYQLELDTCPALEEEEIPAEVPPALLDAGVVAQEEEEIPAEAGMTVDEAGITPEDAGLTLEDESIAGSLLVLPPPQATKTEPTTIVKDMQHSREVFRFFIAISW
jgi:hypothetical protein